MADLHKLFIRVDAARISAPIKLAIRMLVLTFVRPGELRCAQWPEIDLETGASTVPAERPHPRMTGMKTGTAPRSARYSSSPSRPVSRQTTHPKGCARR